MSKNSKPVPAGTKVFVVQAGVTGSPANIRCTTEECILIPMDCREQDLPAAPILVGDSRDFPSWRTYLTRFSELVPTAQISMGDDWSSLSEYVYDLWDDDDELPSEEEVRRAQRGLSRSTPAPQTRPAPPAPVPPAVPHSKAVFREFKMAPRRRRVPANDTVRNGTGNPTFNVFSKILVPANREEVCVVVDANGPRTQQDPKAPYVLFFSIDGRGWPYMRNPSKSRVHLNGVELTGSGHERHYLDTNGGDELAFPLFPEQSMSILSRTDGVNPLYSTRWRRDS